MAKLRSYELLRTAPAGSTITDPASVSGAKVADGQRAEGGTHNGRAAWTTTQSLSATARFYADSLMEQGWQDVETRCSGGTA